MKILLILHRPIPSNLNIKTKQSYETQHKKREQLIKILKSNKAEIEEAASLGIAIDYQMPNNGPFEAILMPKSPIGVAARNSASFKKTRLFLIQMIAEKKVQHAIIWDEVFTAEEIKLAADSGISTIDLSQSLESLQTRLLETLHL